MAGTGGGRDGRWWCGYCSYSGDQQWQRDNHVKKSCFKRMAEGMAYHCPGCHAIACNEQSWYSHVRGCPAWRQWRTANGGEIPPAMDFYAPHPPPAGHAYLSLASDFPEGTLGLDGLPRAVQGGAANQQAPTAQTGPAATGQSPTLTSTAAQSGLNQQPTHTQAATSSAVPTSTLNPAAPIFVPTTHAPVPDPYGHDLPFPLSMPPTVGPTGELQYPDEFEYGGNAFGWQIDEFSRRDSVQVQNQAFNSWQQYPQTGQADPFSQPDPRTYQPPHPWSTRPMENDTRDRPSFWNPNPHGTPSNPYGQRLPSLWHPGQVKPALDRPRQHDQPGFYRPDDFYPTRQPRPTLGPRFPDSNVSHFPTPSGPGNRRRNQAVEGTGDHLQKRYRRSPQSIIPRLPPNAAPWAASQNEFGQPPSSLEGHTGMTDSEAETGLAERDEVKGGQVEGSILRDSRAEDAVEGGSGEDNQAGDGLPMPSDNEGDQVKDCRDEGGEDKADGQPAETGSGNKASPIREGTGGPTQTSNSSKSSSSLEDDIPWDECDDPDCHGPDDHENCPRLRRR